MGLLTDRINNKLGKSNLINEHALNREPVPLNPENTSKKMTATVFLYECKTVERDNQFSKFRCDHRNLLIIMNNYLQDSYLFVLNLQ